MLEALQHLRLLFEALPLHFGQFAVLDGGPGVEGQGRREETWSIGCEELRRAPGRQ